jgi:hypothetical protein
MTAERRAKREAFIGTLYTYKYKMACAAGHCIGFHRKLLEHHVPVTGEGLDMERNRQDLTALGIDSSVCCCEHAPFSYTGVDTRLG